VVCDLFVMDESDHLLAQIADEIVNRAEFSDFVKYVLIVLNRSSYSKFYSALIERGMEVSEQRGNPPPLSPDNKKLLAEIQALEAQLEENLE